MSKLNARHLHALTTAMRAYRAHRTLYREILDCVGRDFLLDGGKLDRLVVEMDDLGGVFDHLPKEPALGRIRRLQGTEPLGLALGRGYNSRRTGDFWIYLGSTVHNGMLYFWKPSASRLERLTEDEALNCFDPTNWLRPSSKYKADYEEGLEAWSDGGLNI